MARHDEVENRTHILLGLKAQGYAYNQLVEVGQKYWGVSARQIKRYLQRVAQEEQALAAMSLKEHLGVSLSQYRYLYAKALQEGNMELARRVKQDELRAIEMFLKHGGYKNEVCTASQSAPEELGALVAALEKDWSDQLA